MNKALKLTALPDFFEKGRTQFHLSINLFSRTLRLLLIDTLVLLPYFFTLIREVLQFRTFGKVSIPISFVPWNLNLKSLFEHPYEFSCFLVTPCCASSKTFIVIRLRLYSNIGIYDMKMSFTGICPSNKCVDW